MPESVTNQRGYDIVSPQALAWLKPPGAPDTAPIERIDGAFRDPATGKIFSDQNGVPSLLTGVAEDTTKITGAVKAFYEDYPFPSYEGYKLSAIWLSAG